MECTGSTPRNLALMLFVSLGPEPSFPGGKKSALGAIKELEGYVKRDAPPENHYAAIQG